MITAAASGGTSGASCAAVTARAEALLEPIVDDLLNDRPLAARLRDHALTGKLARMRDCHVRPDLVLIYSVADQGVLKLVRLGSHSELGIG